MRSFQETDIAPEIFVFCALSCEAKPLIAAWRLKKLLAAGLPFAIYADQTRVLVISGMGKSAMAGAVGYVLGLFKNRHPAPLLINLGIAGHPHHPLGTVFLAHKVVDVETGRKFFPQLPFVPPCKTLPLTTYSKPQTGYADDHLYDMEAAGFYEMAVKFSTSELIHVLKIISDNGRSTIENINESMVENWVGGQLKIIETLLVALAYLQHTMPVVPVPPLLQHLLGQFHFTMTNAIKLKALLMQWSVVGNDEGLEWSAANFKSANQVISWLEQQLNKREFRL